MFRQFPVKVWHLLALLETLSTKGLVQSYINFCTMKKDWNIQQQNPNMNNEHSELSMSVVCPTVRRDVLG